MEAVREVKKTVSPAELILALEEIPQDEKPQVRLNYETLQILHEEVGQDKFLELVGKVALHSNRQGFDFVKLITLRKTLSEQ